MSRNKKKNYYRKMNKKPKQVVEIPDDYTEEIPEEAGTPEKTEIPEEAEISEAAETPEETTVPEEAGIPEETVIPEEIGTPEKIETPEEAETLEDTEIREGAGESGEAAEEEPEIVAEEEPEPEVISEETAGETEEEPEIVAEEEPEPENPEETAGEIEAPSDGASELETAEETAEALEDTEDAPEDTEEAQPEIEDTEEPGMPKEEAAGEAEKPSIELEEKEAKKPERRPPERRSSEKRPSEKRHPEKRHPEKRKSAKQKAVYRPERYNVLFVSEDGRDVRSFRTSSDFLMLLAILAALLVIGVIGYVLYTVGREDEFIAKNEALQEELKSLSEDIIVLKADKEELQNELRVANALLETGMAKHEDEGKPVNLKAIPAGLPVNGVVALPSQYSAEKQYITFMTGGGSKVVAAGEGTVVYAGESVEFGYAVRIDHGNGYVTTYYEDTPPAVKEGVSVKRGDTLYVIEADNQTLTYQVAYEDQFIDPYTVMDIDG